MMRDDNSIYIFNIKIKRLFTVKSAYYSSQSGYKTLDLITIPNGPLEFDVVYLETGETDAPNNATTTINRITFTQNFMNTLKQIASQT